MYIGSRTPSAAYHRSASASVLLACIGRVASSVSASVCGPTRPGSQTVTAGQTALLQFESCDRFGNRRILGGDAFAIRLSVDPANADANRRALTAPSGSAHAGGGSTRTARRRPPRSSDAPRPSASHDDARPIKAARIRREATCSM